MIKVLSRFSMIGLLGLVLTCSTNTFASDTHQRSYTTTFMLGFLVASNWFLSVAADGCYEYVWKCPANYTELIDCKLQCSVTSSCFPEEAQIEVLNSDEKTFSFKPISELVENDWILTGYEKDTQSGEINKLFEPIIEFLHREPNEAMDILEIYFKNTERPLKLSKEHMVKIFKLEEDVEPSSDKLDAFVSDRSDKFWKPAHEVQVNDVMFVDGKLTLVSEIKSAKSKGKFAPLTKSGQLIVDGALVSAFAGDDLNHSTGFIYTNLTRALGIGNKDKISSSGDLNKDVAINEVDSEARKVLDNINKIYSLVAGT